MSRSEPPACHSHLLRATKLVVDLALIPRAGEQVGAVAAVARQADRGVAGEAVVAAGEIGVEAGVAVAAGVQGDLAIGPGRGVARQDLNDPPGRVAAEQGSLRTVQHLDPFDSAQVEQGADRGGEIDSVDIGGDAVLDAERRPLADSAQEGLGEGAGAGHHQAGNGPGERGAVRDLEALELLSGADGERDGDVLGPLGPPLRGDDDVAAGSRGLREGRLSRAKDGSAHQCAPSRPDPTNAGCRHILLLPRRSL